MSAPKRSRPLVYVAGPLFTPGDRSYLESIDALCGEAGFRTYLPHRDAGVAPADGSVTLPFFEQDVANLRDAAVVVAVLNGTDVDSGTAFELGYAHALGKPLLGIYEDTRISNVASDLNLMITSSVEVVDNRWELLLSLLRARNATGRVTRPPGERQLAALARKLDTLDLDLTAATPATFGYRTLVLVAVDAVLSINRPYRKFVVPRVERVRRWFGEDARLAELHQRLEELGEARFGTEILDYRDPARVRLLGTVTRRLASMLAGAFDAAGEVTRASSWFEAAGVHGNAAFAVDGIGLATYQYLRMLCGVSTVKPDVHIVRFVSAALGRPVPAVEAIELIEQAAKQRGVSATTLDHAIWRTFARA